MAITLNPLIADLGIMAPVLGPWFSINTVNLNNLAAAQNLGMTVNFASNSDWYAPATGTLSLYITNSSNPPDALDTLQDSRGTWPFPDGQIVAYFRLLPEVEARLHALMSVLPSVTANPIGTSLPTNLGTPTRAQVRSFAIVLPASTPLTPAGLYPFLGGAGSIPGSDDREKINALGLALDGSGNLANSALPMTWLRRPGGSLANRDKLLFALNGNFDFWVFDRRGRAIDPGAVACWWSWLLNTGVGGTAPATNLQLFPSGLTSADYPLQNGQPVVVQFAAHQTVHLVDAHEGPIASPFIGDRLQRDGSSVSANLLQATGTSINLSFSTLPAPGSPPPPDNPTVDNAPRPRLAVLPNGNYGNTASLWPGGPVHVGLTRDFARVAVVDEESHLTGLTRRDSRQAATTALERRQSAQNRPSTRINVNRTTTSTSILLPNSQATANALLSLSNSANPTRLVLGLADLAWGGTAGTPAAVPAPGAGPLPISLNDAETATPAVTQYRVRALTGGGALAENHQTVLLEVNLGPTCAGAWVRAWPLGFDLNSAVHFRMSGGAGRADVNGLATLTMLLINGLIAPQGLMGMDLLVVLPDNTGTIVARRHYADRRFTRPAPLGGSAPTAVSGTWVVCEAGISNSGALPSGSVPPGGHVVLLDSPAILDRTAIPAAAWENNILRNRLQATDIVSLTLPAYGSTPDRADSAGHPLPRTPSTGGNPAGGIDSIIGNRLHLLDRELLTGVTASSVPYALMDRVEVAAATTGAGVATAVIGGAPPVPWALEPLASHFLGYPTVPAAIEVHGTGVLLNGGPAVAVAEYVRERTAGLGFTQVQGLTEPARSAAIQCELAVAAEAATALPSIADGAGAGPVVAVLRTSALGMEGVPGVAEAARASNIFPLSQNEAALEAWLNANVSIAGGAGTALRRAAAGPIDSITRALDRRLLTSAFGARETLVALLSAINRAQDLVFIETTGVDTLVITSGGENLQFWQALINRMNTRKGLRVVLCVPSLLAPGTPRLAQEVRDQCLTDAIDVMRGAAPDRFVVFSPGVGAGRALRIASTSVVVDDAFAITGSTHLTRRGLSWDSSLAAAVFDEQVVDSRPQDIVNFRTQLLADRLGIPFTRVPIDPSELVKSILSFDTRGSERLSVTPIVRPETTPANTDIDVFNPDGSASGLTLASVAAAFAAAIALTDVDHAIIEG